MDGKSVIIETMRQKAVTPRIDEVPSHHVPMGLLLLADPSEQKMRSYLPRSRCFAASSQEMVVGTALLKWVAEFFRRAGARQLEVGTGTFGYQLAFYQRQGFRVTGIGRDFFIRNYGQPIFEAGIRLRDMLRLTLTYGDEAADRVPAAAAAVLRIDQKR